MEIPPAVATLIGAIVGATAALVGVVLTGIRQAKIEENKISLEREKLKHAQLIEEGKISLEHKKLNHAQAAALNSEMRQVVQNCVAKMASATHSMCWLTWLAEESPKRITEERVKLYDDEIHVLLPEIIGLQARISTYNSELGKKFGELLLEIEDLDARIGAAALHLIEGDKSRIEELKSCHGEANILFDDKLAQVCDETSMEKLIPKA